jgi:predicted TIM-barrel fold metal-dependent hydrolase
VGFIDCDTHVLECDDTWDYFDPSEREYKPITIELPHIEGPGAESRRQYFVIGDTISRKFAGAGQTWGIGKEYKPEASYLTDPSVRLREMDLLGVDVQIVLSTDYLTIGVDNPFAEAALARSYNRWVADRTADSGGRLRWVIVLPTLTMERCIEELEFGAAHGAVGVLLKGIEHGLSMTDPYYHPLYKLAEELDLTICNHGGFARQRMEGLPFSKSMPTNIASAATQQGSFSMILNAGMSLSPAQRGAAGSGLHDLFPNLRFAFIEGGATWIPAVFEQRKRGRAATDGDSWIETDKGTALTVKPIDVAAEMEARNLYVAAFATEDLPYLTQYCGPDHLVVGTDYCHNDAGTDPLAHTFIMARTDLDAAQAKKICDDNGRAAFNIPRDFTPAGPVQVPEVATAGA